MILAIELAIESNYYIDQSLKWEKKNKKKWSS